MFKGNIKDRVRDLCFEHNISWKKPASNKMTRTLHFIKKSFECLFVFFKILVY